jgi:hypothetical protein
MSSIFKITNVKFDFHIICSGKAQKQFYSTLQAHPLVRESATK